MLIELMLAAVAAQEIEVIVIDHRSRPVANAEVYMSRSGRPQEPPQLTLRNGRTRFSSITCSDQIKFFARRISGTHSDPSSHWPCANRVGIKMPPPLP